jgi:peptide chain release factor
MMMLLQLSAAQGPDECALAVAKALPRLREEAAALSVTVEVAEAEAGAVAHSWLSLLLVLEGEQSAALAARWSGTLLWICASPLRPTHRRKNWFFGGHAFAPAPEETVLDESGIRIEALRASGPGGQHVNKTASAVRATHLASGLSVKMQSARSQHANRRLAVALLRERLRERETQQQDRLRTQRRDAHHTVERGNPARVFRGEAFVPERG